MANDLSEQQTLSLADFQSYKEKGFLVVDTRNTEAFAEGLIPGSVNIPYNSRFEELAGKLLDKDRGIILLSAEGPSVIKSLKAAGFTNVAGFLEGGMKTWQDAGKPIDMVISIEPGEFALDFKHDEGLTLFDLRPEVAFQQAHLTESFNRTPEQLLEELPDLHGNKTYYLLCADGQLSMGLMGFLKNRGYHNFYHVSGGFEAVSQEEKVELTRPAQAKKPDRGQNSIN
jgi:hydroxyacylglutathione hydrolase